MTLLKNIPTPLRWSIGILTIGVGVILFTVFLSATFGFGITVPAPEDPHPGYATGPGIGRWYETHLFYPSFPVGFLLILIGTCSTLVTTIHAFAFPPPRVRPHAAANEQ